MADKKLNEVTKVTDMAYVPVIMSDGSIGQIAKADLATVVAGQMSYIAQETGAGITDLNELKGINNKTTLYRFVVNSAPSNSPGTGGETRFYVEVANIGDSYIYQRFIGLRNHVVYQRFCSSSSWTDWQQIS